MLRKRCYCKEMVTVSEDRYTEIADYAEKKGLCGIWVICERCAKYTEFRTPDLIPQDLKEIPEDCRLVFKGYEWYDYSRHNLMLCLVGKKAEPVAIPPANPIDILALTPVK